MAYIKYHAVTIFWKSPCLQPSQVAVTSTITPILQKVEKRQIYQEIGGRYGVVFMFAKFTFD